MKEVLSLFEKFQSGELTAEQFEAEVTKADYVPRKRLNDKITEVNTLKDEIKARDGQILDLQKAVKGNEELEKKLTDLERANGDWAAKYKKTQIETAIKLAAKDAKDPADVLAFINKDGLELSEDGTVKGLDEALKTLRESKSYLFGDVSPGLKGRQPNNPPGEPKGVTKEQFKSMGYTDRLKLYNENPDLYNQLNQ
jgi:hypothetical protein